jgi:hypothetical protein
MEKMRNTPRQERVQPHIEGCATLAKSVDAAGLEHSRLGITPGSYEARIGFRPFGRFESDWFSAATDNQSAQERPLEIDAQNPDVVRFSEIQMTNGL